MTIKQGRLPFGPLYNRNLLSNHWLENRLLLEPEWKEYSHAAARALHEVSQLWKQQSKRVEQYAEPSLEEAFIQPIFKALGWTLLYQTYLRGRKPDYALFLADSDLDRALAKGRKSPDFWVHAAVVADLARVHAVVHDADAKEQRRRDEAVRDHLHQGAFDAVTIAGSIPLSRLNGTFITARNAMAFSQTAGSGVSILATSLLISPVLTPIWNVTLLHFSTDVRTLAT